MNERTINLSNVCVCFFFFDCFGFERQNVAPVDAPTFSVGHASNDEAVLPENVDDLVCFKVHVLCFVCVCVCVFFFCQQLLFFSFENRSKACKGACRCKLCKCRCSTRSKSTKAAIRSLNGVSNSRAAVFLAAVCAFDCVVVVVERT